MTAGLDGAAATVETGIADLASDFSPNVDRASSIANDLLSGIDALATKIGTSTKVSQSQATVEALEGLAQLAQGAGTAVHSF